MKIEVFGHTDIGKKREINEDNYICLPLAQESMTPYLLAVADGMGGHSGGEMASTIAIDVLRENILYDFRKSKAPLLNIQAIMEDSCQKANEKIFSKSSEDKQLTGMGTTLVAAFLSDNRATISNIGDSRAYHVRKNSIRQITLDHTWKAEQIRTRTFSEEEVLNSPYKDMITRYLGYENDAKLDIFEVELSVDDYLLLCSDGLYTLLADEEILAVIAKIKRPEEICHQLIMSANQRGGHDNITVVVAQVKEFEKPGYRTSYLSDTRKIDYSKNK